MEVAIIGSGTMGSGIAQVMAEAGNVVTVYDADETALKNSAAAMSKILQKLVEKGKYSEEKKEMILQGIQYVGLLKSLKNADLVIEAIVEDLATKKTLFKQVEKIVQKECIITTNTSSLSCTGLAAVLNNPERFIGLHFFNPVPLMKLVEVIPAVQTDKKVINKCLEMVKQWGKVGVLAKDTPGFIVNRIARPYYGEALRIFEEGIANHATIDWAMEELGKFKMGPFKLMDLIGLDVNYAVNESVFKAFYYDPRYRPSFSQMKLVEAGYLGKKSGRGFYNYQDDSDNPVATKDAALGKKILERILVRLINEAADACYLKIASKEDIDLAMTHGVNYPKGLLMWADELGIEYCVNALDNLFDRYHENQYRCAVLLRNMAENHEQFFAFKLQNN